MQNIQKILGVNFSADTVFLIKNTGSKFCIELFRSFTKGFPQILAKRQNKNSAK